MNTPSVPNGDADSADKSTAKTFACLNCTRRKVKCDKARPTCGSCTKTNLQCVFAAPPPPRRHGKRKADAASGLSGRSDRHGDQTRDSPASARARARNESEHHNPNPEHDHPQPDRLGDGLQTEPAQGWTSEISTGTMVSGPGRSRYINSSHWRNLGDDEVQHLSHDFDHGVQPSTNEAQSKEGDQIGMTPGESAMHPLTAAFMGFQSTHSLLDYHPAHEQAMALCKIHCARVEPLCKILHIPSAWLLVRAASQQPALVSRSDECLLFAIYHFAVFAMTDQECLATLQQSRSIARSKFAFAARQALANACFLQTTEMSILQALTLFLLAGRDHYDPHTYWIMTGTLTNLRRVLSG
ncbi:hypothetical protein PRZ48_013853 [Zasmidium cellare]|uniref:Zn(2)-C6 fungal-type domain-containing protein n=1 Tax=Zasmidium cellare TaxID=395010 RepID=A0ABR0E2T6_ZASCE|nr:hypothetical protein PRZ48_013853 [Zasmidium cellare]